MVLVAGGQSGSGFTYYASAELFNPLTGTWTLTGSMNQARASHTATLLATGKVLVAGGTTGCFLDVGCSSTGDGELYDPASGQWTLTGTMAVGQADHTATMLFTGRVLVSGGVYQQGLQEVTLKNSTVYVP